MRIIIHADLDAFFAAVEENRRPELKGKPLIVYMGTGPKAGKGRGVVSTANYEARKHGVKSGMPIERAHRACPSAAFLPVDMEEYARVSQRVMAILEARAERFEQVSVDEAFLDVSGRAKDFAGAKKLAEGIQRELMDKERLSCSFGIAPNRLVAKIASGFKKPAGITVVKPEEVKGFLAPMKPRELWGVGPKTEERLDEMGIGTVAKLAATDPQVLLDEFGTMGPYLRLMAIGLDDSPVEGAWEAKSVSRERTFEEDTDDKEALAGALAQMALQVCGEIQESGLRFKTVTIKVRFSNFETHTASKTLAHSADDCRQLLDTGILLLGPFLGGKKIRLVGLRASGLVSAAGQEKLA